MRLSRTDLPFSLRRFAPPEQALVAGAPTEPAPEIVFPPAGARVDLGLAGGGAMPLGHGAMFALSLAVFFHLAKGVQHLIWDTGVGLKLQAANPGAVATVAFAIVATIVVWIIAAMTGAL